MNSSDWPSPEPHDDPLDRFPDFDDKWNDDPDRVQPPPAWTREYSAIAISQGWDLFDSYGSECGPLQIQRLDGLEAFDSDEAAWTHVMVQATCRVPPCPAAVLALNQIQFYNRPEYDAITGSWLRFVRQAFEGIAPQPQE